MLDLDRAIDDFDNFNTNLCSDLRESWQRIKTALVEAQKTPTNTSIPKFPTLEECQAEVQSRVWGGSFVGTSSNITEIVYNFISRKLRA